MTVQSRQGCELRVARDMDAALDLWAGAFPVGREEFAEGARSDPWRREDDVLGAFCGGELVSAVSLIRRPLEWRGGVIWLGGIGNVATREDWRRRGLSRELLKMMIRKMEEERFALSLLFTGVHGHYSPLGWRIVETPGAVVTLARKLPEAPDVWEEPAPWDEAARLYESLPQPHLALARADSHFHEASVARWKRMTGCVLRLKEAGYVVVRLPEDSELAVVTELVAVDAPAEEALAISAAHAARRTGGTGLKFEGLPLLGGMKALKRLGAAQLELDARKMFRNVSLPQMRFDEITRLFRDGRTVWWRADDF